MRMKPWKMGGKPETSGSSASCTARPLSISAERRATMRCTGPFRKMVRATSRQSLKVSPEESSRPMVAVNSTRASVEKRPAPRRPEGSRPAGRTSSGNSPSRLSSRTRISSETASRSSSLCLPSWPSTRQR